MQFGYFTLSDNRYPDNRRTAEDFLRDIYAEALFAEKIGMTSAWIGEHHFNLLGPVVDLPTTMSKFLYLGMPMEKVIRAATAAPAAVRPSSAARTRPARQQPPPKWQKAR